MTGLDILSSAHGNARSTQPRRKGWCRTYLQSRARECGVSRSFLRKIADWHKSGQPVCPRGGEAWSSSTSADVSAARLPRQAMGRSMPYLENFGGRGSGEGLAIGRSSRRHEATLSRTTQRNPRALKYPRVPFGGHHAQSQITHKESKILTELRTRACEAFMRCGVRQLRPRVARAAGLTMRAERGPISVAARWLSNGFGCTALVAMLAWCLRPGTQSVAQPSEKSRLSAQSGDRTREQGRWC